MAGTQEFYSYLNVTLDTAAVATAPYFYFYKTRAGGAVSNNDYLGTISFYGDDGAADREGATISCRAVGTIAATRMPGQLVFSTAADSGGSSPAARMTISPAGNVTIAAPDSGTGLTISGGGIDVTGAVTYTATEFTVVASAAAPAVAIQLEASAADGSVAIQAGSGGISIGDEADTALITLGDVAPTASRTITIGGGTVVTASVTDTIDIGPDGATTNADSIKTVNINTGGVTLGQVLTNIASGAVTSGTHTTSIATGNVAAGTVALNVMTGSGTKTASIGNADGLTTLNIDAITLINDSINVATSINTGTSTGAVSIGNALAGAISADSAAGISLDAALASNFTVSTAANDLTLESALGTVIVISGEDTSDAIYLHANGGVSDTIRLHADTGTGADSIHLESDLGGVTLTATANATADAINLNAPLGGVDIDGALAIDINSSAAGISVDGVLASNFTVTGAGEDLTLSSIGGSVLVSSTENAADAIYLHVNGGIAETIRLHADQSTDVASVHLESDLGGITLTATGLVSADAININAPAGGLDVDTDLDIVMDSASGALDLDAVTSSHITVTGAAADMLVSSVGGSVNIAASEADIAAISIQASDAASGIDVDCGSLGFDLLSTGGPVSIDAQGALNVTTTGAFDATFNSTLGSVIITAGEAAADSINIDTAAGGGIDIDAGSLGFDVLATGGAVSIDAQAASNFSTTTGDLTIASTAGSVVITSGEGVTDAVQLTASNAAGGLTVSAGAGAMTLVTDANGTRYSTNYRVNAALTTGPQAVGAAGIVVFGTEAFDPGNDYNSATGVFTAPATGIYRITAVVNCTDGVGGGTKTISLRDGGVATNFRASQTVGNAALGSLSLSVLHELTAADTVDIYYEGGAGDTVNNYSHLMIEYAYSV